MCVCDKMLKSFPVFTTYKSIYVYYIQNLCIFNAMNSDWKTIFKGKVLGLDITITHHDDYGYRLQYIYPKDHMGVTDTQRTHTEGDLFLLQAEDKADLRVKMYEDNRFTEEQVEAIFNKF